MSADHQTLAFYNQNAEDFAARTVVADMSQARSRFTAHLPSHSLILDFGCGSGRDTRAFLEAGYRVEASDGSEELCAKASEYTGIPVRHMLFQELTVQNQYDGVWACASILHLPKPELADVLRRIETALKPGGILYASFKYGSQEGLRDGRYFTDSTEETLTAFWKGASTLQIFDLWLSRDVREDRRDLKWINLLARRTQE